MLATALSPRVRVVPLLKDSPLAVHVLMMQPSVSSVTIAYCSALASRAYMMRMRMCACCARACECVRACTCACVCGEGTRARTSLAQPIVVAITVFVAHLDSALRTRAHTSSFKWGREMGEGKREK